MNDCFDAPPFFLYHIEHPRLVTASLASRLVGRCKTTELVVDRESLMCDERFLQAQTVV